MGLTQGFELMMILYITIDEDKYGLNTRLRADDDSLYYYR